MALRHTGGKGKETVPPLLMGRDIVITPKIDRDIAERLFRSHKAPCNSRRFSSLEIENMADGLQKELGLLDGGSLTIH